METFFLFMGRRKEGELHPGPAHGAEDGESMVSNQPLAGMLSSILAQH
jgi:hypothetical protein